MLNGLSAVAVLTLVCVHLFAARGAMHRLSRGPFLSFSGGAAAAYVFLYILPVIYQLASELPYEDGLWPDGEWVFVAALAGTCLFHAVEMQARRAVCKGSQVGALRFWVNLAAFALYNLLVGALLVIKPYANVVDALVHQIALILHFAVVDATLRARHPEGYDRIGRWVMAGAVAIGWTVGLLGMEYTLVPGLALAFLAGGMILNVLKEELTETENAALMPFLTGAGLFAILFLAARGMTL